MARVVYTAIASLDGYVADTDGRFDWSAPDEEVHAFVNDLERETATMLLGRRMYEVLVAWETMDVAGEPVVMADFQAIWRAADKVVYSRTLDEVASERTRIERAFDPDAIRGLEGVASIGGPTLAAEAIRAGLVSDYHLIAVPHVVGGGTHWLPDGVRRELDLVSVRSFASGVVHTHHRDPRVG